MNIVRSNFKLSFTEVEFHTNVSRKTGKTVVTCTLSGTIRQPEIIDQGTMILNALPFWDVLSNFSVTGKAVCSVKDENQIEIGKAVAQAKAEAKCYETVSKMLHKRVTDGCAILIKALGDFENKADRVIKHNKEYIDQVSDPNSDLHRRRLAI